MAHHNYLSTTLDTYEKLGKSYVESTWGASPTELEGFTKLVRTKGKLLEIGCAGGRDCKLFSKKGFTVTGIDLVETFLRQARKNAPKARFFKMDCRKLRFADNSFDAVWASAILLHLQKKDAQTCLREINRVLAPGGIVHVRVKLGKGRRAVRDKLSKTIKRIFTYFLPGQLKQMVQKAGLTIVKQWTTSDDLGRNTKWIVIWARKPLRPNKAKRRLKPPQGG